MEIFAIAYTIALVLFTVLTFGWLFHCMSNKNEATRAHYLLALIPFAMWLECASGAAFGFMGIDSITNYNAPLVVATGVLGVMARVVIFFVLALIASGFCLNPAGMVHNRLNIITAVALADGILGIIQTSYPMGVGRYLSWVIFVIAIVKLVLLRRYSVETYHMISTHQLVDSGVGNTWAISHHRRVHVAEQDKKIILTYLWFNILSIAVAIIFTIWIIVKTIQVVADADSNNPPDQQTVLNDLADTIIAWTIGLLALSWFIYSFIFIYAASVWRLGQPEAYGLLPQHAAPGPIYNTMPVNAAPVVYGVAPTGYAPAPQGTYQVAY